MTTAGSSNPIDAEVFFWIVLGELRALSLQA